MSRATDIAAALDRTRARIAEAERAAGRPPGSTLLIAVGKRMIVDDLRAAHDAGQRDFGENYAQELRDKQASWAIDDVRWHFIGPLQSNKLKLLSGRVHLIHSLDSPGLLAQLSRRAGASPPGQDCLVQVNLLGEARKSGVPPERLTALLDAFATCPQVRCRGLMLIPPQLDTDDETRRCFAGLRALAERERAVPRPNVELRELSMGMSDDFELAIAEGATMVRIGTAIFGARPR
jgi:PLP dependent protein